MTSKTKDLEHVKAMLFDALTKATIRGDCVTTTSAPGSVIGFVPPGESLPASVVDGDKLATTVMEFFAGREAEQTAATVAMLRDIGINPKDGRMFIRNRKRWANQVARLARLAGVTIPMFVPTPAFVPTPPKADRLNDGGDQ